jgi:hypothetical protein
MIIRDEQLDAFRAARAASFEQRLFLHLHKYFPERCAVMGGEAVRHSIRRGVARARSYGIICERDVARFLNHVYFLGPDFDTDPKYPWAQDILRDPAIPPSSKMQRLSSRTAGEMARRTRA